MQQTFDISRIFDAKARRRLALAALPWEAKVAIVEQMRQSLPKDVWKSRSVDSARGMASDVARPLSDAQSQTS